MNDKISSRDVVDLSTKSSQHVKMCKKIAQLTKIIYQLNTLTEDREAEQKDSELSYQIYSNKILKESADETRSLKNQLKAVERSHSAEIEVLRNENNCEKAQAKESLASLKNDLNLFIKNVESRFHERIQSIVKCVDIKRQEVTSKLKSLDDEVEIYKKELAKNKVLHINELQLAKRECDRSVGSIKLKEKILRDISLFGKDRENEEQILKMQTDSNLLIESLELRLHEQDKSHYGAIIEKDMDYRNMKEKYKNMLAVERQIFEEQSIQKENEISKRDMKIKTLKESLSHALEEKENRISCLESESNKIKSELSKQTKKFDKKVEELQAQLTLTLKDNDIKGNKLQELSALLEIERSKYEAKNKKFKELFHRYQHSSNKSSCLLKKMKSMLEMAARCLERSEKSIGEKCSRISAVEEKLTGILKMSLENIAKKFEEKKVQNRNLYLQLKDIEASNDCTAKNHGKMVNEMKADLAKKDFQMTEVLSRINAKHGFEVEEIKENLNHQIHILQNSIKECKKQYADALQLLIDENTSKDEEMKYKHSKNVEEMKKDFSLKMSVERNKITELTKNIVVQEEKYSKQIHDLRQELQVSSTVIENLHQSVEAADRRNIEYAQTKLFFEGEISKMNKEMNELKCHIEYEISNGKETTKKAVEAISNECQVRVNGLVEQSCTLKQSHRAEVEALHSLIVEKETLLRHAEEKIQKLSALCNEQSDLQNIESKEARKQISDLKEQMELMKFDSEEQKKALVENHLVVSEDMKNTLCLQEEQYLLQIKDLNQKWRKREEISVANAISQLEERHKKTELMRIKQREEETRKEQDLFEAKYSELRFKSEECTEFLNSKVKSLEQLLVHKDEEIQTLRDDFSRADREAKSNMESAVTENLTKIEEIERQKMLAIEGLNAAHDASMMKCSETEKALKNKILKMEERFRSRPSRSDDIEKISHLKSDLREKTKAISIYEAELAQMKLEFRNREDLYNRRFNVSPVVGVMQVLSSKNEELDNSSERRAKAVRGSHAPPYNRSSSMHSSSNLLPQMKATHAVEKLNRSLSFSKYYVFDR